jgi:hypothetical protein
MAALIVVITEIITATGKAITTTAEGGGTNQRAGTEIRTGKTSGGTQKIITGETKETGRIGDIVM